MFRTCGYGSRTVQRISLETFDHSNTHHRSQISIFATSFGHTPPTGIASHIYHRRKCPADTHGRSLHSRYPCTILSHLRVERCRLSQGNREYGLETVDHITRHQQGDAQAGLLHCHTLQGIDTHRIYFIQDRPDFTFLYQSAHILYVAIRRNLVHLPNFFLQCHTGQQRFYFLLDDCVIFCILHLSTRYKRKQQ